MGSFNTSCFVSQQIIAPGDESVILPIIQQATYDPVSLLVKTHNGIEEMEKYGYMHSSCYPTAFWGYYGPMIRGKYDDYGQFELDDTESNFTNLISLFNQLHKNVCDVKQGENDCHDHPMVFNELYNPKEQYTFEQLTEIWEKIWEMGQESRLFATDYHKNPCSIAFAVMHKPAADYLVDTINQSTTWNDVSLEQKSYFHSYVNQKLGRVLEIFKDKKEKEDIITFGAVGMLSLEGFGVGEQEGTYIGQYYDYNEKVLDEIIEYFKQNPEANSISKDVTDEIFESFKEQIEHRYLAAGLSRLNLRLSPMVYASQDYSNDTGNSYLEMLKEVNAKVNAIVKEKYGEDDDE
jgi:hypothetical protein